MKPVSHLIQPTITPKAIFLSALYPDDILSDTEFPNSIKAAQGDRTWIREHGSIRPEDSTRATSEVFPRLFSDRTRFLVVIGNPKSKLTPRCNINKYLMF